MTYEERKRDLLSDPAKLMERTPYTRMVSPDTGAQPSTGRTVRSGQQIAACAPSFKSVVVPESELMAELDPYSHKVLFDENIPSITVKTGDGKGYLDIEYAKMAVPFQRLILDKQVLHMCSAPMQFTLLNTDPDDSQQSAFTRFKQGWDERNMDGHKTDFFRKAKSVGSAGCLFYFDRHGKCKARTLSYIDGYQVCPHRDDNGEVMLASVCYRQGEVDVVDTYDDEYLYRWTNGAGSPSSENGRGGWAMEPPVRHGFPEIPLVVKSSRVAWDRVQSQIEVYEVIANIFSVSQKKYGWNILYVKGQFNPNARRIAGAQVLNDASLDPAADAKFLEPPTPKNMIEYLDHMKELIQLGSGTTFILPKDIKAGSDASGLAIQLTQELDMETARNGISEWQNCASKMARLFKAGLAAELVASGEDPTAITSWAGMRIGAKFQAWRPQSDEAHSQMLATLRGAGGISQRTLVEKNVASTPDEMARIRREAEEAASLSAPQQQADDTQQAQQR